MIRAIRRTVFLVWNFLRNYIAIAVYLMQVKQLAIVELL